MVKIDGKATKVRFIVNELGYSRRFHFWCTDSLDAEHTYEGIIRSLEYFERVPEVVPFESDLAFEPAAVGEATLQALGQIDDYVLGFRRAVDHRFLMQDRTLYLYRRNGFPVGYGYLQKDYIGPFALLDDADYPAVLAHAESEAHALGAATVGFETPTVNKQAIDHFMRRGYRLQGFMGTILSDQPFGRLSHYILTSPPFFI